MAELSERLSRIEAVQHFHTAAIAALAKMFASDAAFVVRLRESLQLHQAALSGESTDEVKVKAYEELMEVVLGKTQP